jgi:hypothetical protein
MSNAGSALMGIGRASGEHRAVQAAQQAIESPLLEVSIDGARGILFNVIGGHDMSMHEINSAAEAITAAADPDANIIFGATINPDLEGEIIITVVATGFDASYFTKRAAIPAVAPEEEVPVASYETTLKDDAVSNLDMDLTPASADDDDDDSGISSGTSDFTREHTAIPNIWSLDHDDDKDSKSDKSDSNDDSEEESELEKPSFLRRLKKRVGEKDEHDSKEDSKK